ncbi:MAG: DNA-directed RNA polymerase subunit K [Candidatus Micrarchaeota archaeon]|nr:DNA-directed RNA polymerase subunit K [Candidatus Micrarchaeota archaeon]
MPSHTLNKFELARILGARSLQISYGAPPLMEVKPGESSIDVARRELDAGIIPLVVLR